MEWLALLDEDYWAFALLLLVGSITPGPNNILLAASGARFGLLRSMPHVLGVSLGGTIAMLAAWFVLETIFQYMPWFDSLMKWVCITYLVWLAWRIGSDTTPIGGGGETHPYGLLRATYTQWVNPKIWIVAVGIVSAYLPPDTQWQRVALMCAGFFIISMPCQMLWTLGGQALQRYLQSPGHLRIFNVSMALLLLLSLIPTLDN